MIRLTVFAAWVLGSLSAALGQTNSTASVPATSSRPANALGPATVSGPALVRAWHRQFFHHEADLRSVAAWSYWFRLGNSPEQVLAAMLSTDEYYRRAGGTREGLVQAMFEDGARAEFAGDVRQTWLVRARTMDRQALAASFLQTHPGVLQRGTEAARTLVAARQRSVATRPVGAQPRDSRPGTTAASSRRSRPGVGSTRPTSARQTKSPATAAARPSPSWFSSPAGNILHAGSGSTSPLRMKARSS